MFLQGMGIGYVYNELKEFGRAVCACVCCLFVAGPAMLIAGIIFLASAQTDTRGADIAKYNKAVDAWTSTTPGGPFASFQNLSNTAAFDVVDISSIPNANPTRSLVIDTTSSSEQPSMEAGTGINPYTQRLIMSGNSVANQPFPTYTWPPSNIWLASIGFRISGPSRTTKWLNLTSIPIISYSRVNSNSKCSATTTCAGGTFTCISGGNSGYCERWWQLTEICVVWDATAATWQTSGGCAIAGSGSTSTDPGIGPSTGMGQRVYSSFPRAQSVVYSVGMKLRVRAKEDPWLVGMGLTSATGSFGLTVAAKVAIGGALIGVGAIVSLLPCVITALLVKFCAHRKKSSRNVTIMQPQGPAPIMMAPQAPGYAAYTGASPPMMVQQQYGGGQQYGQPQMVQQQPYAAYEQQPQGYPMPPQLQGYPVQNGYGQQPQMVQQQQQQQSYMPQQQQQSYMPQQQQQYMPQQQQGFMMTPQAAQQPKSLLY